MRVQKPVWCVVAAIGLLMPVQAEPTAGQDRQVLVTVLNADDTPVTDLAAADFLVYEDGVSRTVTAAVQATDPLSVMLLVDTSKSPNLGAIEPTRDIRTAAQTFVKTIAAAGVPTQMAIMDYIGAGTIIRGFTDKLEDVEKAAGRLIPSQRSNSVLLETLVDASRDVARRPGPRRAIVVLDRGALETSRVQGEKITDAVQKSGASVWAVSLPGGASSPARDVALDSFTAATGGLRLTAVSPTALEAMMKKVADALVSQYLVTYTPGPGTPQSIVPAATRGAKFLRAPFVR